MWFSVGSSKVEADDLALDAAAHVGDLLGPLADERDHEEDLRVVGADAVGDLLEEHRLAGLGRADDEGALALAERVDEVDEPLAQVLGVGLEVDQLVRVDRGQVAEDRPASGRLGIDAVDAVDPEHAPVLLRLARGADGAGDAVADAQAEPADLAGADVDVLRAGQQAVAAHEAEALVDDVEDAGRVGVAGALGLALEDALDELVLALSAFGLELEVAGRASSVTLISRRSLTSRSFRSRRLRVPAAPRIRLRARGPPGLGASRGRRFRERSRWSGLVRASGTGSPVGEGRDGALGLGRPGRIGAERVCAQAWAAARYRSGYVRA